MSGAIQGYINGNRTSAWKMTLAEYHDRQGMTAPRDDENGDLIVEDGYCIDMMRSDSGTPVTTISFHMAWLPVWAFHCLFCTGKDMPFGQAVEAMKQGKRVARAGWNGQGMFAYLVPAASYPAQTGVAKAFFGDGALVPYRQYMALKTAQGDVATWAPSGSDALADDWYILD